MSTSGTLRFWANPLSFAPNFDHTWVTTYPFVNGQYPHFDDKPADGSYWYCWGEYHGSGAGGTQHHPNGAIGEADADLDVAGKLVQANVAPPKPPIGSTTDVQDGSITFYAVDGVCHNVANQVLFATGSSTVEPRRVTEARGYHVTTFFYTNYGLNNSGWNALRQSCAPSVPVPGDDFNAWFDATLGGKVSLTKALEVAAARAVAQVALQKVHRRVPDMTANEVWAAVGAINLAALAAVEKILGEANFFALFPSLTTVPENEQEATIWVDRDQLEGSVERLQRRAG